MGAENIGELETLFSAEASNRRIVLDLKDLTLVDQDAVSFLGARTGQRHAQELPSIHPRMDPPGTEEKAQRIVRGTNMAWENAVLSDNQNDVEACLAEQAANEADILHAQQPNPPPRRCSQVRIQRPSGNERQWCERRL